MPIQVSFVEYNSILWSPNLVYLIDLIESVQRKFIKRINSLASVTYSSWLNLLNLQPLELRRLHLDLTNYYKILNGLSPLTPTDYFLIYSPLTSTRSTMPSLRRPLHASSKLSSSFFYRSVDAWNHLPFNIRLLNSLNSFKSSNQTGRSVCFFKVFVFLINYVVWYYFPFYYVVFKFNGLPLALVNDHSCNPPIACILTLLALCF